MIEGVSVRPLRQILDERGKVMHMLRSDDAEFDTFGEIYFSAVHPGAIKAWHVHHEMARNYAVPHGKMKLVLYDDRVGSSSRGEVQEIFLGPDNYCLVHIPRLVWSGFKGIGTETSLIANCTTIPHRPEEAGRLAHDDPRIPYDWKIKHG